MNNDFDLQPYLDRAESGADIRSLEDEIFPFLCVKRRYLKDCEPGYCIFRLTAKCPWIKAIKKLRSVTGSRPQPNGLS